MSRVLARSLLVLVLAALAVVQVVRFRSNQEARAAWLVAWETSGIIPRHPDAWRSAKQQSEPHLASLQLARVLLADSLDLARLSTMSTPEAVRETVRIRQRLATAQGIAESALRRRPTSWEAATVLGGVALVDRLAAGGDPTRNVSAWSSPLTLARRLAPREIEPVRLEAVAYLARWHALSDGERKTAQDTLTRALSDPSSLPLLLPGWMAVTDRDTLFASLPDTTVAWSRVADELARQGRWGTHCEALEQKEIRRRRELQEGLEEAKARWAGGDVVTSRRLFLQVIHASVASREDAATFEAALLSLPPGPINPSSGPSLEAWANWGLDLWVLDRPSLTPAAFARLASYGQHLSPETTARAWIAAGDRRQAETLEQRANEAWSEDWAPYLVGKARVQEAEGHTGEARATLARVHRNYRTATPYRLVAHRLGITTEDELQRDSVWPSSAWGWRGRTIFLDFQPLSKDLLSPFEIQLSVDSVSPADAPVELQWNGRSLGCRTVPESRVLRLNLDLDEGVHRLVLQPRPGVTLQPGELRLVPAVVEPTEVPQS